VVVERMFVGDPCKAMLFTVIDIASSGIVHYDVTCALQRDLPNELNW